MALTALLLGAAVSAAPPGSREASGALQQSRKLSTCEDVEPPPGWEHNTCAQQHKAGECDARKALADGYCRRTCGLCEKPATNWLKHLQLVHIPKTGGGTLATFAQAHQVSWAQYRPGNSWPGGNCPYGCHDTFQPCSSWHIPPMAYINIAHQEAYSPQYERLTVTRHPYPRAISEFLWRRGELPCNAEALNKAVHHVMKRINASVTSLEADYPHVAAGPLAIAGKATFPGSDRPRDHKQTSDCHWLPQWLYTRGMQTTILHTETLTEDFTAFVRKRGGKLRDQELRGEDWWKHKHNTSLCELPVGALDDESLRMLDQVYAGDFEAFGYKVGILRGERLRVDSARSPLTVHADDTVSETDVDTKVVGM